MFGSTPAFAQSEAPNTPSGEAVDSRAEAPLRLAITVFAEADGLDTFAERVRSWFDDGTSVTVEPAALHDLRVAATEPSVITIWVIVVSREKALVTFSTRTDGVGERHVVRHVALRDGLDELGLERLASVIQSTVVAIREGSEGSDLETMKAELRQAGVELAGASPAPGVPPAPESPSPAKPDDHSPVARVVPSRSESPLSSTAVERRETRPNRAARPEAVSGLHVDVHYGGRFDRERELFHGPSLGVAWPFPVDAGAWWLVLRGGRFWRTDLDAPPFALSVQTSSARVGVAFERRSRSIVSPSAAILAGVDVTRVRPRSEDGANDAEQRYVAAPAVTKAWAELGLVAGVWFRTAFDVGVFGAVDYCLNDVRYVMESSSGDRTVLRPWRLQPGLFVSARFDVTPSAPIPTRED